MGLPLGPRDSPVLSSADHMRAGGHQIKDFDGLVRTTARMFASQVKREEHDLEQELRIRVWRAVESFEAGKVRGSAPGALERYVFSAITNKIKDYKRDAAREAQRRKRYGIDFVYIEDTFVADGEVAAERFDGLHHFVERETVYGRIEGSGFVLPSTVTESETSVLLLLMMELSKVEIVVRLGVGRVEVDRCIVSLKVKLADWKPTSDSPAVVIAKVCQLVA